VGTQRMALLMWLTYNNVHQYLRCNYTLIDAPSYGIDEGRS
jgi:hypothetical protein